MALARPSNADGTGIPHSSGSQFFIDTGDNSPLSQAPIGFNLFGDVTTGLDVAKALQKGDKLLWVSISSAPAPAPSASPSASPSPAAPAPSPS